MERRGNVTLAPLTTLRVGGPAATLVETDTTEELVQAVRQADEADAPLLVLGAGSNVLICDAGFSGTVVRPRQAAIGLLAGVQGPDEARATLVRCEAGARWDDVVAFCVREGLAGVEALSGIPGLMGSAVMQNIGAYGQEMASALVSVTLLDRATGEVRHWGRDELGLGYRSSLLRRSLEGGTDGALAEDDGDSAPSGGMLHAGRTWFPTPRWVVLDVTLGLARSGVAHVEHPQLARALGVEPGAQMEVGRVREAVLEVRGAKAMLAEQVVTAEGQTGGAAVPPVDHDRWSSGSFFMNPVLTPAQADRLPEDAPRYPAPDGVKTSAAWLIEHAGFARGFGVRGEGSRATLSTRHCLALTNRGHASADDLMELARTVRCGVFDHYGVLLQPETVLIGEEM